VAFKTNDRFIRPILLYTDLRTLI